MTHSMHVQTTEKCLSDRVTEALSASPHIHNRQLGHQADQGVVVLTGTVNSYFQKQMAQEAIRRVDGVDHIDNRLEVEWLEPLFRSSP